MVEMVESGVSKEEENLKSKSRRSRMYYLKSTIDFNCIEDALNHLEEINGLQNIKEFFTVVWEEEKNF
jgi:hypothetical protein